MNDVGGSLVEGLNPRQREAVEYGDGPLLVVAGAGSGKTRVIVHRIAHLIRERGVDPWRILAVTFTNKAAGEMHERVGALLGERSGVWVSTFHKFGAAVLRKHIERLGYPATFVIYDESDQQSVIKNVLKANGLDPKAVPPNTVKAAIERLKRAAVPEDRFAESKDPGVAKLLPVIIDYQARLKASQALDFSDLLYLTHRLFAEFPEVLEDYHRRFSHFLVDEYQDTNHVQYLLVKQLSAKRGNVCVVGDEDQSIYGWRGANIRNILDFEEDFPKAKVILLEQNYRSTKTIIEAASGLIAGNRARKAKKLWTENDEGIKIRLYGADDDISEAAWVVEDILRQKSRGRNLTDVAVFYRTHAQSRVIEDALRKFNMAYKVYGGARFYDRKEIKDAVAYLQLLANPADEVAFGRIVNVPPRGIGARTQELVAEERARTGGDWLEAIGSLLDGGSLNARAGGALKKFYDLMADLRGGLDGPVAALTEAVLDKSGYRKVLEAEGGFEAEARLENLEEFQNGVGEYERLDPAPSLRGFLEMVTLTATIDGFDEGAGLLSLMTLHNAKGLEFPVVYMVGMVDGLLPHQRALYGSDEGLMESNLEEERRLCYVGMTRAREELILSWPFFRMVAGHREASTRSQFLEEISEEYLKQVGRGGRLRRPEPVRGDYGGRGKSSRGPRVENFGDSEIVYDEPAVGSFRHQSGVVLGPGDRVMHPTYGEGVIQRFEEAGRAQKIVVRFSDCTKKFSAAFAPLTPV